MRVLSSRPDDDIAAELEQVIISMCETQGKAIQALLLLRDQLDVLSGADFDLVQEQIHDAFNDVITFMEEN